MLAKYTRATLLTTVSSLHEQLNSPDLCLIDVRPAEDFARGHIPGAIHWDLFGLSLVEGLEAIDALKVALKDLEIRGAGNLLGPEQTGFVVGLGFDLYVKLLEEAVAGLKGDAAEVPPDADLPRINASAVHIDFMIGSDDVSVTGTTKSGDRVPILRGGSWQI